MVERLFHINRDKLLSIPAFAGVTFASARFGVAESFPAWQGHPSEDRETKLFLKDLVAKCSSTRQTVLSIGAACSANVQDRFGNLHETPERSRYRPRCSAYENRPA